MHSRATPTEYSIGKPLVQTSNTSFKLQSAKKRSCGLSPKMKAKANKRTNTFEEISKEYTVRHQDRSKIIGRMEMMTTGDRTIIMGAAIKIEAVAEAVVAVMGVIITTREDATTVLEKAEMVITEEEEAEGHEEATSPWTM